MANTAQNHFDRYLAECRETNSAINDFVNASQNNYGSYAHAAGTLTTMLFEVITHLPRAKRSAMRDRLYRMAQDQKNEAVMKQLKVTA